MRTDQRLIRMMLAIFAAVSLAATMAQADVVTDANARAADIASKLPATPPAVRVMNTITQIEEVPGRGALAPMLDIRRSSASE